MTALLDDAVRAERLPGVGRRYDIPASDGQRLSVVIDRRGDRHPAGPRVTFNRRVPD